MPSAMVRVSAETHAKLKELAAHAGEPMPAVLDKAVEAYRRQKFLTGLADDFRRLRDNPESWRAELQERQAWDVTLADGLEED